MVYDQGFKDIVIQDALATNFAQAARKHGINEKTVSGWVWKWKNTITTKQEPLQVAVVSEDTRQSTSRVLAIPDMHHPFCHPDALEFLKAVYAKHQCNKVVCMGDEIDAHGFSKYPMDPNGLTAGKEIQAAIETLRPFYTAFPNVLVCESNHTIRPWKKAYEAGLPDTFLRSVEQILNAPEGWRYERFHQIDGVLYMHGDNGKSGQYAAANYMKQAKRSVVIGHIHAYASVFYEGRHFGMNTGCLIDKEAYAFKYARGSVLDVNIGCGVVIDGVEAYFVPMRLDSHGRWIGKL